MLLYHVFPIALLYLELYVNVNNIRHFQEAILSPFSWHGYTLRCIMFYFLANSHIFLFFDLSWYWPFWQTNVMYIRPIISIIQNLILNEYLRFRYFDVLYSNASLFMRNSHRISNNYIVPIDFVSNEKDDLPCSMMDWCNWLFPESWN